MSSFTITPDNTNYSGTPQITCSLVNTSTLSCSVQPVYQSGYGAPVSVTCNSVLLSSQSNSFTVSLGKSNPYSTWYLPSSYESCKLTPE